MDYSTPNKRRHSTTRGKVHQVLCESEGALSIDEVVEQCEGCSAYAVREALQHLLREGEIIIERQSASEDT